MNALFESRAASAGPSALRFGVWVAAALVGAAWVSASPEFAWVIAPGLAAAIVVAALCAAKLLQTRPRNLGLALIALTFAAVDLTLWPHRPQLAEPTWDYQVVGKSLLYLSLCCYGLVYGLKNQSADPLLSLFFLYAVFAALTCVYSSTQVLAVGGGVTLVAIALAASVVARWPPATIAMLWSTLFLTAVIIGAISLAEYVVWPDEAIARNVSGEGRLQGITGAPNALGPLMAIGILIGGYDLASAATAARRWAGIAGIAVLALALVMSQSRTAMLALAGGLALAYLAASRPRVWIAATLTAFCALLVSVFQLGAAWLNMATSALSRSGETSEITTATGRVDIWRFCFSKWLEAPWFGYGLGSPRRVIPDGWSDSWGFTTGTAHNFVLESLLSVGVIGTLPLLAVLFGLALGIMRLLRRSPPAEMRPLKHLPAFMVACWSFLIIEGCFEKTFAGLASPATVILAVLLGSLVALKNLPRAESR